MGNTVVCLSSQERLYQEETYELDLEEEVHLQMPGTQQFLFHVQLVLFRRPIALDLLIVRTEPDHTGQEHPYVKTNWSNKRSI